MELLLVILWLCLSFAIAAAGSKRKIGWGASLLISLLLSPLIGGIFVMISDKKAAGSKRWKQYEENAKRAELKGQAQAAIDNYTDAIFYLKNDYPNLSRREDAVRQTTLERLRSKVEELKITVQPAN